jgi:surfactin synthase thioesterase subunit
MTGGANLPASHRLRHRPAGAAQTLTGLATPNATTETERTGMSATHVSGAFVRRNPYIRQAVQPSPRVRLVCMPHVGGGASAFAAWPDRLPAEVEVLAVQPPGREDRLKEKPVARVGSLIAALTHVLRPYSDLPLAFFGHSAGAALAFELAQTLHQSGGAEPVQLFLSGHPAPGANRPEQLHDLPDDEFERRVRSLGGTQDELFADPDMARYLLRVMRADFTLWEKHTASAGEPLPAHITVLGGQQDPRADPAELDAWRTRTRGRFRKSILPGGHFYLNSQRDALLDIITEDLLRATAPRPTAQQHISSPDGVLP